MFNSATKSAQEADRDMAARACRVRLIPSGHRSVVLAAVACACFALSAPSAPAAGTPAGSDCIAPNGRDLNAFFGVSARIVAPPFCTQIRAGESWTVASRWVVNDTFASTPAGFLPAGATPLEDFIAKFTAVKYVTPAPGLRKPTCSRTTATCSPARWRASPP
jgi:hypothetical protein